jgi:FkbM family methyltransferase
MILSIFWKVIFARTRRKIVSFFLVKLYLRKKILNLKELYSFKLPDGSKFIYPINSAIGNALFLGDYEPGEIEFIRQMLKPGDSFLDIGANGGLYSIIASKVVGPKGQVYACEPSARERALLMHNININNIENITVLESAMSDKKGISHLAISKDGALNSLIKTQHPGQDIESYQQINTTTVDDTITELNIRNLSIVKIDVEGAEKMVIEGARKTLRENPELSIIFESSSFNTYNYSYSPKELILFLQSEGFQIFYINRFGLINPLTDFNRIQEKIYNFIAHKSRSKILI